MSFTKEGDRSAIWVEELVGEHLSGIWNLAPLCLMWSIWRECNNCTFEDEESSGNQLLASFIFSLFDWSRAWNSHLVIPFQCYRFASYLYIGFLVVSLFFVLLGCFVIFSHETVFF